MEYVNWEYRPALVLWPGTAYAVLRRGGGWEPVIWYEVIESGTGMKKADFHAAFDPLPPMPPAALFAEVLAATNPEEAYRSGALRWQLKDMPGFDLDAAFKAAAARCAVPKDTPA